MRSVNHVFSHALYSCLDESEHLYGTGMNYEILEYTEVLHFSHDRYFPRGELSKFEHGCVIGW